MLTKKLFNTIILHTNDFNTKLSRITVLLLQLKEFFSFTVCHCYTENYQDIPFSKTSQKFYAWLETQTTNQWQCNHGRRPEANVGQQYRYFSEIKRMCATVRTRCSSSSCLQIGMAGYEANISGASGACYHGCRTAKFLAMLSGKCMSMSLSTAITAKSFSQTNSLKAENPKTTLCVYTRGNISNNVP